MTTDKTGVSGERLGCSRCGTTTPRHRRTRTLDRYELRDADAEYHRFCMDVHEPTVPLERLQLDELAGAVERLADAIARLHRRER